jgi:ATP-dependent RNA helicase RhlE
LRSRDRLKENELTTETNTSLTGFEALGITGKLLQAANAAGFIEPKPIQEKAIPAQLKGRDILGIAQTGSGKTAAFALPILKRIMALHDKRKPKTARALVLAPTRELAVQIEDTFKALSKGAHVSTALGAGRRVARHARSRRLAPASTCWSPRPAA